MPVQPEERAARNQAAGAEFGDERMTIPVIEEEVTVEKHVVPVGKVNITKRVREEEQVVDVPAYRGQVNINRVPVNLFVDELPQIRQEGDTMIIPIVQEQMVMVKKLLLVEELHVQNQVIESHHPQTVTLLKEEVDVRRTTQNEHLDPLNRADGGGGGKVPGGSI